MTTTKTPPASIDSLPTATPPTQPQPQTQETPEKSLNPTATPFLPAITTLRTLSPAALTATLDLLFEPSPDLHALALPTIHTLSFTSYDDLIATLRGQLLDIAAAVEGDAEGRRRLYGVLGSHPRLGQKKQKEGEGQKSEKEGDREGGGEGKGMSELSKAEQGHLTGAEVEEELGRLNEEYERRFPGLRYVVWVNGRGREEVVEDMRERIQKGDLRGEVKAVIEAMCDIAADRARKLLQKSAEEAVENTKS